MKTTEELIPVLARQYAEERLEQYRQDGAYDPTQNDEHTNRLMSESYEEYYKILLGWLAERCYIVEKETVVEHFRYAVQGLGQELKEQPYVTLCDRWHYEGEEYGRRELLKSLFPDIIKEFKQSQPPTD